MKIILNAYRSKLQKWSGIIPEFSGRVLRIQVVLFVILTAVFCGLDCFGATPEELSRNCQLGDSAFQNGSYEQAAHFFRRYVEESEGRDVELRDALNRYISACIRAEMTDDAERALDTMEKRFPDFERLRKMLYRADILILRFKYAEAEALLQNALASGAIAGDIYFQLLSSLGNVLLQQEKWNEAIEIFGLLEKSGAGTEWETSGFKRKIYAMIMSGNLSESGTLLNIELKVAEKKDITELKILTLLLMIQEKRFSEFKKSYSSLVENLPKKPNVILYAVDLLAAKHFLRNNASGDAIVFLKDGFDVAPSAYDRKNILRMLVNTYVEAGMKKAAIATIQKFLDFYPDVQDIINIKFQCVRLMIEQKMDDDALKLLNGIIKNPQTGSADRCEAAKQALTILTAAGKNDEAAKLLRDVTASAAGNEKSEIKMLTGKFYFDQKKYAEAAYIFTELAAGNDELRWDAALWQIKAIEKQGQYAAAMDIINKIYTQKLTPFIAGNLLLLKATVLEKMEKFTEAREAYLAFVRQMPGDEQAPNALFNAGNLSYQIRDFTRGAEIFRDFTVRYPGNAMVPNAFYKCLYAAYYNEDEEEISRLTDYLIVRFLDSPFTIAALFWQVDYLRNQGQIKPAEEILKKIESLYPGREDIVAQSLYDRAIIAENTTGSDAALKILQELFSRYPNSKNTVDALYLAGNIASRKGSYGDAVVYYRQVAQLRPQSQLEIAALGRIGDCNFTIYGKSHDSKYLNDAMAVYGKIIAMTNLDPAVRSQTMYKLGKCYEAMDNEDKALEIFNELLYGYQLEQNKGKRYNPIWAVKAGYAAAMIHLRRSTPESAAEAVKIYRQLESMQLDTGEDFKKLINNIKTKYKI